MSETMNFEGLLHEALSPIEPPEDLGRRLESALTSITESAVEELEAWELSAMRDPRNWVRPATAVVVGGSAGVALVLIRARHRPRPSSNALRGARQAAERAIGDLGEHTRRLLGDR
ncbi:MAG TPA: hypothetical protein VNX67_00035 [Solirubrobacteraceae bacterium]|jgi:hypothetical protein|nr:hypothetical protein [Solirubrobacteraceae bacterium]